MSTSRTLRDDPLLCPVVTNAAKTMPVIVGYGFDTKDDRVVEFSVPRTRPSLPQAAAHLAAFSTSTSSARLTPLFFKGDATARRSAGGAPALAATPSLPSPTSRSPDQSQSTCRTIGSFASSPRPTAAR